AIIFAVSTVLVARVLLFREPDRRTASTPTPLPVPRPKKTPVRTTPEAAACQRLLERATFDLAGALDKAVAAAGGIPVKAELEDEDGRAMYSVDLVVDGK